MVLPLWLDRNAESVLLGPMTLLAAENAVLLAAVELYGPGISEERVMPVSKA